MLQQLRLGIMEIKDKNGKLLAMVIDYNKINQSKYFATDNSHELQVAAFNLEKNEKIIRHIHPPQERKINSTSEVLIILEGQIEYEIYDEELEFCESGVVGNGSMLVLINGGHGLKILDDAKFIEVKQGPYDEATDKVRF